MILFGVLLHKLFELIEQVAHLLFVSRLKLCLFAEELDFEEWYARFQTHNILAHVVKFFEKNVIVVVAEN